MRLITISWFLCLSIIHCSNAAYMAVFLNEDMKNLLQNKFFRSHEQSSPFSGNTGRIYCEHSTIEFNPKSDNVNNYKLHYGHIQKLTVLAYAEDEHAQAILVHSTNSSDSHFSMNEYPHVTISVSNIKPYTAVYSNDLWKRLVDNGIIQITMDENEKPKSIIIKDQTNEWNGKLNRFGRYQETQAYVKIVNEIFDLNGTFCVDYLWKNDKCQNA